VHKLNSEEIAALSNWHKLLNDNRGDRARLRRAESPEDILLTSAFFNFLQKMPETFLKNYSDERRFGILATIAGLVSHVETPDGSASFATQLATPPKGKNKPPMSELRFQQLQKSPTIDDFYRRMIRAIRLLGKSVNVSSLANDIIHWHDEFKANVDYRNPKDRLAVRWATDYFTALSKLPKSTD
jgi:CRISPR type I-E/ECOLI-associated protein CasB/Cse2